MSDWGGSLPITSLGIPSDTDWCASPPLSALHDTVHHNDATSLIELIGTATLDLIVTDPPYGVGTQVSQHNDREEKFREIVGASQIDATWIRPAYAALKEGGALYVFCKWVNIDIWTRHIRAAGFDVKNWLVWDKGQHGSGDLQGSYAPQHEMIVFSSKGRHLLRGNRLPDIVRLQKVHPTQLVHPYEKPIRLLQMLIKASSDDGGFVCDPFAGSGTTLYAAKELGRRYIGGDVDADAVAQTNQRLTGVSLHKARTDSTISMFAGVK